MDANKRRKPTEVKRDIFWFACTLSIPVALTLGIIVYGLVTLSDSLRRDNCPVGFFRCGNLSECVAQQHQCDGVSDCTNAADEDPLVCADNEGYLQVFVELFFKSSGMHFDQCVLEDYPSICHCSYGSILNCLGRNLTGVPQPIPANTTKLHLSNNRLEILTPGTFRHLHKLEKLYLGANIIEDLQPGCLIGLDNLQFLDLKGNLLTTIQPGVLDSLHSLKHLDLSNNKIYIENSDVFHLPSSLEILILERNRLNEIGQCCLRKALKIRILLLGDNDLTFIHPLALSALQDLYELNISSNNLRGLEPNILKTNGNMAKLILDNNPIEMSNITAVLRHTNSLTSLSMKQIQMSEPCMDAFTKMENLTYVTFDSHRYCRYVPQAQVCVPKDDGISSLRNLMDHVLHRVSIWVIAMVTLTGNMLVIVCRIFWKEEGEIHAFFIRNLCAADMMTGLFLVVIAVYDQIMRDEYNRHALWWVNSWACTAAGVLGVLAAEVSVVILAFMSFERFVTISFPYRARLVTLPRARLVLLAIWSMCLVLAILPLTSERAFGKVYTSNGVCFPLFLDDPYSSGWQYSVFILVGINFVALSMVCYFYAALFYNVRRTQGKSCQGHTRLTKRLLLIVFTYFACIAPVVITKIVVLVNIPISANLYAWLTVFVLPVNSASNPLVYTVTTPSFYRMIRNVVGRRESISDTWVRSGERPPSTQKSSSV